VEGECPESLTGKLRSYHRRKGHHKYLWTLKYFAFAEEYDLRKKTNVKGGSSAALGKGGASSPIRSVLIGGAYLKFRIRVLGVLKVNKESHHQPLSRIEDTCTRGINK